MVFEGVPPKQKSLVSSGKIALEDIGKPILVMERPIALRLLGKVERLQVGAATNSFVLEV